MILGVLSFLVPRVNVRKSTSKHAKNYKDASQNICLVTPNTSCPVEVTLRLVDLIVRFLIGREVIIEIFIGYPLYG